MSHLSYWGVGSGRVLGGAMALALTKSRKGLGVRCPKFGRIVARVLIHVSSEHDGDRILHVARLDAPPKIGPHDGGARTTLGAVSGIVLAAQSCREDQDSDVKWGRWWLSGGGLAGGASQLHPLGVLVGHAGSRGRHRHGCS